MTTKIIDGLNYTSLDLSMVSSPPKGTLIISSCPGLCKENGTSDHRKTTHLDVLQSEEINLVIALTPDDELERLGVDDMPQKIKDCGIDWKQVAGVNYATPEKDQLTAFMDIMSEVQSRLDQGDHILVHCRGGTGRAGKTAAVMLIHYGIDPDQAIDAIRSQREGCIQTAEQEQFVRDYCPV